MHLFSTNGKGTSYGQCETRAPTVEKAPITQDCNQEKRHCGRHYVSSRFIECNESGEGEPRARPCKGGRCLGPNSVDPFATSRTC